MVGDIPDYFDHNYFLQYYIFIKLCNSYIYRRGGMDKMLMFSCVPLKPQLIADAADNTVIYLCEPCQPCEAYNYSN